MGSLPKGSCLICDSKTHFYVQPNKNPTTVLILLSSFFFTNDSKIAQLISIDTFAQNLKKNPNALCTISCFYYKITHKRRVQSFT